jgi:hypothetical protein
MAVVVDIFFTAILLGRTIVHANEGFCFEAVDVPLHVPTRYFFVEPHDTIPIKQLFYQANMILRFLAEHLDEIQMSKWLAEIGFWFAYGHEKSRNSLLKRGVLSDGRGFGADVRG